ncbi:hypothetical protein ABEX67_22795 [Bacillus wiedmannii]|uniref:PD-(D/E)XK nuclease domain-containing protein n=1 Tax=Bacillus wiedmannii TaxID=1890302 RepID=UPI003D1F71EC
MKNVYVENESDLVEINAFGHTFRVLPGIAKDLLTLESDGIMFTHFWNEEIGSFSYYKIQLTPSEIYQFVEAHLAMQQFEDSIVKGASFEQALNMIDNKVISERVRCYGDYGKTILDDGSIVDIRGCPASFYPPEIEELLCGQKEDRYELCLDTNDLECFALLMKILDSFPTAARFLERRTHSRPPFLLQNEYDVQDLLFSMIRSVFEDAKFEEYTIKHVGKSKRIDIIIPSANTVIEVKFVRDVAHARKLDEELKIDIESYYFHSSCKKLIFFVWDPNHFIIDPVVFTELSGYRQKGKFQFDVDILVRD